jgi:glutamate racemase
MPLPPAAPVGVFDSGAGGLSVAGAIRAALPAQELIYFADTAYAPYGQRSDQEILARTQSCCSVLLEHGVAALVVACNTATANAIDELRAWAPVPVIGVEPGLKPAAAATRNGIVGVLATRATLGSRRYRDLLYRVGNQMPAVKFIEHAAVGWVERVEAGDLDSVHARTLVRQAVQPLLDAGADTLVLGCTHYPFLRAAIETVAGGVHIIETGPAVARELQRRLEQPAAQAASAPPQPPQDMDVAAVPATQGMHFASSGDTAAFTLLATQLLGVLNGATRPPSGLRRDLAGA